MAYSDSSPSNLISKSILKTLAYSDIFDFPLTEEELWKFLICDKKIKKDEFEEILESLSRPVIARSETTKHSSQSRYKNNRLPRSLQSLAMTSSGYYCLIGREQIISKRKRNLPEVDKKFKIAQKVAKHLAKIPTIMFIGISGSLAMEDAEEDDDIDFFIITNTNKLYSTRLTMLLVLEKLKVRRKRHDKNPANKICVNLLIDESEMSFRSDRQDLYIAHEIAQIKPLFQRNNMYYKFLEANSWLQKFLPNFEISSSHFSEKGLPDAVRDDKLIIIFKIIDIFLPETLTRLLQTAYMRNHKKNETVTKHLIGFHPMDYRVHILNNLRLKYQQLGLLTNL